MTKEDIRIIKTKELNVHTLLTELIGNTSFYSITENNYLGDEGLASIKNVTFTVLKIEKSFYVVNNILEFLVLKNSKVETLSARIITDQEKAKQLALFEIIKYRLNANPILNNTNFTKICKRILSSDEYMEIFSKVLTNECLSIKKSFHYLNITYECYLNILNKIIFKQRIYLSNEKKVVICELDRNDLSYAHITGINKDIDCYSSKFSIGNEIFIIKSGKFLVAEINDIIFCIVDEEKNQLTMLYLKNKIQKSFNISEHTVKEEKFTATISTKSKSIKFENSEFNGTYELFPETLSIHYVIGG